MVGGYFSSVGGGIPAASLARWDGTSWTDVNGGVGSGGPGDYQYVFALEPCGQDLFVGGNFSSAGGVPIEFIARYDGADWFALGSGVNGNVWDFAQDENTLFVTGEFGTAGGVLCNSIASWDGYEWSPLGSGLNDHAYSLGVFDDDLYVGGWFYLAGGKPSWQIGRWMGASSEVDDRLVPPAPLVRLSNPYQAGSAIHLDLPALGPADFQVGAAASGEGVVMRAGTTPIEEIAGGLFVRGPETHEDLPADLIVVAVGQAVDPSFLAADDVAIERGERGALAADPTTCATSHPAVFAAGDVVAGGRTVTEAMAAGMRAAWGIDRSLRGAASADRRPPPPRPGAWPAPRAAVPRDAVARRDPPELAPDRRGPSDEVVGVFTAEQARAEAARCTLCGSCGSCRACLDTFGCPAFFMRDGVIQIDPKLCTGCGVCAAFCPNDAIKPAPEVTA